MQTKFINCPTCGKPLEYWTIADFIECTGCKEIIQVEPYETAKTEQYDLDYLLNNEIVFVDEQWDELSNDYWWVYFEDEERTKRIDDIDEFVRRYNEVKQAENIELIEVEV